MRAAITVLLLSTYLFSFGQTTETIFFKKEGYKKTKESKAKYKQLTTTYDDGLIRVELFLIENNSLLSVKNYKNDFPIGQWLKINNSGDTLSKRNFDDLVYASPVKENNDSTELDTANYIPATFGSDEKRLNYISQAIIYPDEAKERGIQGTIYITFIVSKEGNIENVKILRGVHPFLDYEAYRAIKNMGKWKPATKDGKAVESKYNMPIKFILAG